MKELIWEITNECLNNCQHCSSMLCDSEGMHSFDLESIQKGVRLFMAHGFDQVILSGGEPGLHPYFDKIIDAIVSTGAEVSIYTSGVYHDDFFTPARLQAIKKLRTVFFSVYSFEPNAHNALTGNSSSFEKTVESLDRFIAEGINVEVNIVPMKQNQDDLKQAAEFMLSRGALKVNFLKLVRQGNAENHWDSIRPDYDRLDETLDCLRHDEYVRVGAPFGKQKSSGQSCGAGYKKICITYDGYILPCEVFKKDRKKFPNIYKNDLDLGRVISSFSGLRSISDNYQASCYKSAIQAVLVEG